VIPDTEVQRRRRRKGEKFGTIVVVSRSKKRERRVDCGHLAEIQLNLPLAKETIGGKFGRDAAALVREVAPIDGISRRNPT
jgi:hypothetical protein